MHGLLIMRIKLKLLALRHDQKLHTKRLTMSNKPIHLPLQAHWKYHLI